MAVSSPSHLLLDIIDSPTQPSRASSLLPLFLSPAPLSARPHFACFAPLLPAPPPPTSAQRPAISGAAAKCRIPLRSDEGIEDVGPKTGWWW